MKKALITGVCGFVGHHLSKSLLDKGYDVSGLYHIQSDIDNFPEDLKKSINLIECDITSVSQIEGKLSGFDYDVVFHLAAIAHVPFAEKNLDEAFRVNVCGTANMLALLNKKNDCRFIMISSSEVYSRMPAGLMPYLESHPVMPSTIYGVTKYSAEMLCSVYAKKNDSRYIIFRPFNHIGPYQHPSFASSEFAKQIAMIEAGEMKPEIYVGNLDSVRDFSDVRDIVEGYILASEQTSENEVFNICSGKAVTIRKLLDGLLDLAKVKIDIKIDSDKFRKSENPVICGSYAKLNNAVGWEPKIPLEKSLIDILNYWRAKVKNINAGSAL